MAHPLIAEVVAVTCRVNENKDVVVCLTGLPKVVLYHCRFTIGLVPPVRAILYGRVPGFFHHRCVELAVLPRIFMVC